MKIVCQPLGPVQANCYIIMENHHALVIDPGDVFPSLESILKENECQLDAVLLTHAHFDHIGGVDALLETFQVPVYLNPAEFDFLQDSRLNASMSFYQRIQCHAVASALHTGMQKIGEFDVEVFFTPGHSIGSSVFKIEDCLFTGDTLFQGSVGRVDLPTGSTEQMLESIAFLKTMDDALNVYPGHGPSSKIEYEKRWNPYFQSSMHSLF